MNISELNNKLRADAIKMGLCNDWQNNVWNREMSQDELVGLFKRGLDFCIKHRWPTKTFIKHNFSQDFLRLHGILVDDTRSYPVRDANRRLMYLREYVLLGKSNATIRYSFRPHICNVWVCDNAHVTVYVKYGAFILIHLFDKATADVHTDLVSKVTVIRHTPDVRIKKNGVVTIKDEFHYLD